MPYAPGDVVWAPDAFHDDDPDLVSGAARPWLVVGNETFPHHGKQYLCCALTSNLASDPDMIPIRVEDWSAGGTTKSSQIDPQTLMTVKHHWIGRYSGHLKHVRLREARNRIRTWL